MMPNIVHVQVPRFGFTQELRRLRLNVFEFVRVNAIIDIGSDGGKLRCIQMI